VVFLAKPYDYVSPTPERVADALAAEADPRDAEFGCAWRTAGHCHRTAWGFAGRCADHPRTPAQVADATRFANPPATFRLRVVGELAEAASATELQQHVSYVADFLLPGCTASNVRVAYTTRDRVVLYATLQAQTTPLPESRGYGDQVPDAEFLQAFVLGAGDCWLRGEQGALFVPHTATCAPVA